MTKAQLRDLLEVKADQYNNRDFIATDPISVPHQFEAKEDIEISAFLAATIAWGQRTTIINNANRLMRLMDDAPADFIRHHKAKEREAFKPFVHRTFNYDDLVFFLASLQRLYLEEGGLENVFHFEPHEPNSKAALVRFRQAFFDLEHPKRTEKHVSNPLKNSSCKRLNMFLRWMVRKDDRGVDFGLWSGINSSQLSCPLDVHSGNVARQLGLLPRKQNDWKAVEELDQALRRFNADDPVRYDFALFGMGAFEKLPLGYT